MKKLKQPLLDSVRSARIALIVRVRALSAGFCKESDRSGKMEDLSTGRFPGGKIHYLAASSSACGRIGACRRVHVVGCIVAATHQNGSSRYLRTIENKLVEILHPISSSATDCCSKNFPEYDHGTEPWLIARRLHIHSLMKEKVAAILAFSHRKPPQPEYSGVNPFDTLTRTMSSLISKFLLQQYHTQTLSKLERPPHEATDYSSSRVR